MKENNLPAFTIQFGEYSLKMRNTQPSGLLEFSDKVLIP